MANHALKRLLPAPDSGWHYALSLALGIAMVAWYAASLANIRYPYTPDSAAYIEAARNLAQGKPPVFNSPVDDQGTASAPVALFPPGFPLLIRAVSTVGGISEAAASVSISWTSWVFLPAALLFALRPVTGVWAAHMIGLLVGISPGVVQYGWPAHSDLPFLLLVIASFGLLVRGCQEPGRPMPLVTAGLLCGFAYLTRNAGIAFVAASAGSIVFLALGRMMERRAVVRRFVWWAAGAGIILIPALLWNLVVFGSLQPYEMPPSDVGAVHNVRVFLHAQLLDLAAIPALAMLAWNGMALLVTASIGLVLLWRARPGLRNAWREAEPDVKLALIALGAYVTLGAATVIIARTRYQWGEPINLRYVLQYSWAVFGVCAVLIAPARSRAIRTIAPAMALVLVCSRLVYGQMQRVQEIDTYQAIMGAADPLLAARTLPNRGTLITSKLKLAVARDTGLMGRLRAYPDSVALVSNFADVFEIETGRQVRGLEFDHCRLNNALKNLPARLGSMGQIRVLVSPHNGMLRSGCWERLTVATFPGYHATLVRPNLLELMPAYQPTPSTSSAALKK